MAKQKAELVPHYLGPKQLKKLVKAIPPIRGVALVVDMGPESIDATGKRQRLIYKVYVKRLPFLQGKLPTVAQYTGEIT